MNGKHSSNKKSLFGYYGVILFVGAWTNGRMISYFVYLVILQSLAIVRFILGY